MIELTANQIKYFDELQDDKEATDKTLNTALNYHSNRINEIKKANDKMWEELAEMHGLDTTKKHQTKRLHGVVTIVEVPDEDNSH